MRESTPCCLCFDCTVCTKYLNRNVQALVFEYGGLTNFTHLPPQNFTRPLCLGELSCAFPHTRCSDHIYKISFSKEGNS